MSIGSRLVLTLFVKIYHAGYHGTRSIGSAARMSRAKAM
jgi:hypothetical protein